MSGIELREYVGYEPELRESEELELDDEAIALQEGQEPELEKELEKEK